LIGPAGYRTDSEGLKEPRAYASAASLSRFTRGNRQLPDSRYMFGTEVIPYPLMNFESVGKIV
jgi:hypothetical protein